MQKIQRGTAWVLTVVGGMFLGAGAMVFSEAPQKTTLPHSVLKTPTDLSLAFRDSAKHVLPAVVTITSKTKGTMQTVANDGEEGEGLDGAPNNDELFRRFFSDDFRNFRMNPGQGRYIPPQMGTGSGVIVDAGGIVLTNSHVVSGADEVTVELQDGRTLKAKSWATDPRRDVAIVKVEPQEPLPTAVLGDSDSMEIGDWVLALGSPFNVGTSVTAGIVSATGRSTMINEVESYIQTDAAVNPGNSGGPLINLNGEVIGINTAISTNSGGYDGVSFAIPVNMVRGIVEQLINTGTVSRSYLGVGLQKLSPELAEQFGVDHGALVNKVMPNTPAAKAELQEGDVITTFAGKKIDNSNTLTTIVESLPSGTAQTMSIVRNGEKMDVSVTPEKMPEDYTPSLKRTMAKKGTEPASEAPKTVLGLSLTPITEEIRSQLNLASETNGLVVKDVKVGSPAQEAGLRPGDVIKSANRKAVTSLAEFEDAIKGVDLKKGVTLQILRGEAAPFLVLREAE